jgi:Nif-specific regulatory protein
MHRVSDHLGLLAAISDLLGQEPSARTLQERGQSILSQLAEHTGMVQGMLILLDDRTGELHTEAAYGLSEAQRERGRYRVGEGVVGEVVATGTPVVIGHLDHADDFLGRTGAIAPRADLRFLCVPIHLGARVIGALCAALPRGVDREPDEVLQLLKVVATMLAHAAALFAQVRHEAREAEGDRPASPSVPGMIGTSSAMRDVWRLIEQGAPSDTTVLIHGESGVGKELVAELFGHERGAFTGAVKEKPGRFELADGGTLFLDEVGDFSPLAQAKLLRALQHKQFERVGGTKTLTADVRVIAATHRDLERLVEAGAYRQDLYYRLNVFPLVVPPLRARRADILLLADHFVERYAKAADKKVRRISTPAIDLLMSYHWPGNVRELENCIERAVLLATGDVIRAEHLPPTLQSADSTGSPAGDLAGQLDQLERELIVEALKTANGNCAKAARQLGISERIIGLRIKKHRLDPALFKRSRRRAA